MKKILAGNWLPEMFPVGAQISTGTEVPVMAVNRRMALHDAISPDREFTWVADNNYVVIGHYPGDLYHYRAIKLIAV